MKKYNKNILALALAVCMVIPSSEVFASDSELQDASEQVETVQNAVEEDGVDAIVDSLDQVMEETNSDTIFNVSGETEETSASNIVTRTGSWETANLCGIGYYNSGYPITIVQATLTDEDGSQKDVYVVGMIGTAFVENQATGVVSDLLAGFNLSNPYLTAVKSAILENVPTDSNIILAGHSLGGMIAQECAADSKLKKNYNILYTVTFGAPLISAGFREGTVKRLGDTSDYIPYISVTGAILSPWQVCGLNRENGGYGLGLSKGWTAHCNSYSRSDVWGAYDVLGFKNGTATLTYDTSTFMHFAAPTAW